MPNEDYVSAKYREFVDGQLGPNEVVYPHSALVEPDSTASELLTFMNGIYDPDADDDLPSEFDSSAVATLLRRGSATDHLGGHVADPPSAAIGITEKDPSMSSHQAFSQIQRSLYNHAAPYIGVMFGAPNFGKTNFGCTYIELWRELVPLKYDTEEYRIVSNLRTLDAADYYVTGLEELRDVIFGDQQFFDTDGQKGTPPEIDPDTPTFWLFDECSTHLDARTFRRQVAKHYTPLVKRFAKVNVDAMHIGHSGMDIHPELRRHTISTEFIFKTELTEADVYRKMKDDEGKDHKYLLTDVPPTTLTYDPDDFSPWQWPE